MEGPSPTPDTVVEAPMVVEEPEVSPADAQESVPQPPAEDAPVAPTADSNSMVTFRVTSAPPTGGDAGPYRQLKVEDALAYLDKVQ